MNEYESTEFLRNDLLNRCTRGKFGLLPHLLGPRVKFDSWRRDLLRKWISNKNSDEIEMIKLLMEESADSFLFNIASIFDGVTGLNRSEYFVLTLVSQDRSIELARGNVSGGSEWHDTVSKIIQARLKEEENGTGPIPHP